MNQIRVNASTRLLKVAAYNERANAAIAAYRGKRTDYAGRWGQAWGKHSAILAAGGEQAATESMIEGIVIGVVLGVLVAATAGAALAALPAAATAAAGTVGTGAWVAVNVGSGVVSGLASAGVAQGFQADAPSWTVARPSVPGPASGQRDAEADAWRAIAGVEESARQVSNVAPRLGLELGNAEFAIAQVQGTINGAPTDMPWPQILDMVARISSWEGSLAPFDSQIDGALAGMETFGQAIEQWQVPSVDTLEREIWYSWMSQLNDHTDEALDQDVIQNYLTKMGLLPDVFYFSDNDQHQAVAAAKAHVAAAAPAAPATP